jgi:DNA modification methylase
VLDPFFGAGTVGVVAEQLGRDWLGIELNPAYARMAKERIAKARTDRKDEVRRDAA